MPDYSFGADFAAGNIEDHPDHFSDRRRIWSPDIDSAEADRSHQRNVPSGASLPGNVQAFGDEDSFIPALFGDDGV